MSRKRVRLLVVDDQTGYCELIREQIELCRHQFDFDCEFTSDHEVATQLLKTWVPSIVLLDIHLHNGSGFELLEKWKEGVSSLVVTSDGRSREIEQRALETGATAYITKTDDPDDIQDLLERIVNLAPELPILQ
jgi:DNA-binding response OmpR family regulator